MEALKVLTAAVEAAEKECGLDWRFSHARILPRDPSTYEIEVSREEMWRAIPAHLPGFDLRVEVPGSVAVLAAKGIAVRLTMLAADASRPLWTVSSVADLRRESAHSSELLSQLIMGEPAFPLRTEGDWHLVRLPDDYHGWIRSWYVRSAGAEEIASFARQARFRVEGNIGYVRSSPDESSLPVSEVLAGTHLVAGDETGAFRLVTLPGGRTGYLRSELIAPVEEGIVPDRARLVGRALRFLGIPYLWGGTTPKGFDCSGLVKRVFQMEGVLLPRDSDRQALAGKPIPRESPERLAPADLLFFGEGGKVGHVAISLGGGRFVHACGEVRINALIPGDEHYDEKFSRIFLFARDVL